MRGWENNGDRKKQNKNVILTSNVNRHLTTRTISDNFSGVTLHMKITACQMCVQN